MARSQRRCEPRVTVRYRYIVQLRVSRASTWRSGGWTALYGSIVCLHATHADNDYPLPVGLEFEFRCIGRSNVGKPSEGVIDQGRDRHKEGTSRVSKEEVAAPAVEVTTVRTVCSWNAWFCRKRGGRSGLGTGQKEAVVEKGYRRRQ
ncbi:hypothetical protein AUEXF2481DRAFT_39589 [Aureobasidium subglaciale EXF-2481]|uniref:Uncharacterized protein n=1 Tax=Aureobasidium subglaciale (strain EXF-2481) TaxID=1043005 RepID=A0A074YD64_AURSE|nr:uncharacterized protein AUEXF2481DRAFT_39589 [Aureobasidium subglaciale EXF-2481]KEQ95733.1 hypothetical protein AUEXF2481DRAFT_39589 [Aureobasidium subglaciale EXF-2481]